MVATQAASRSGIAVGNNKLDLTSMSEQLAAHRQEIKDRTENLIESTIKKLRELRLAGMINKNGADEATNNLILALQALEEI